jgi:hypothetical protein
VSAMEGRYTLFYLPPSPPAPSGVAYEKHADSLVDALSAAWLTQQGGGSPLRLVYDNAVILNRDGLRRVLDLLSRSGIQPGNPPKEMIQQLAPEVLAEQLVEAVRHGEEYFGAAAVYRDLLEDLYKAADQAIQKGNIGLLHEITGKLAFWYVPGESDVKQWGKDFLRAYRRDAGWLYDTKQALEKIKAAAERLEVEEGTQNAELKKKIIAAAEDGLVTHI